MTYSISEMAEILNLTVANVAYRLNRLRLKSPHDESHLDAVKNYLVSNRKQTIWQMVKQTYGVNEAKSQGYSYRWHALGEPEFKSLDELEDLWNKHVEERKKHAEEYKEYSRHICSSASLVSKKTQKLRHVFDWYTFDKTGVWDDEVREWCTWYTESGYKACAARRLAYLEVLKQHHILDQEEYCEFKESKTKLKMAFQ